MDRTIKWMDNNGRIFFREPLSPCPFCGGLAVATCRGNDRTKSRAVVITCEGCKVTRTTGTIRNGLDWAMAVAVEAWNHRVNEVGQ